MAAAQAQVKILKDFSKIGGDKQQHNHYCWTHGPHALHSSDQCKKPSKGHQTKATASNKMGGQATQYVRGKKEWECGTVTSMDTKIEKNLLCEPVIPSPPLETKYFPLANTVQASTSPIIDSGTTGHYFQLHSDTPTFNVVPTTAPIRVTLPNGHSISSTHEGQL